MRPWEEALGPETWTDLGAIADEVGHVVVSGQAAHADDRSIAIDVRGRSSDGRLFACTAFPDLNAANLALEIMLSGTVLADADVLPSHYIKLDRLGTREPVPSAFLTAQELAGRIEDRALSVCAGPVFRALIDGGEEHPLARATFDPESDGAGYFLSDANRHAALRFFSLAPAGALGKRRSENLPELFSEIRALLEQNEELWEKVVSRAELDAAAARKISLSDEPAIRGVVALVEQHIRRAEETGGAEGATMFPSEEILARL